MGLIIFELVVVCGMIVLSFFCGYHIGRQSKAQWLVRPHTPRTLARMPLPEQGYPTVSQAAYVRSSLPNSTSKME